MKKRLYIILLIFLSQSHVFAADLWILKSIISIDKADTSYQESHRLLLKINSDNIYVFDTGKEEWTGSFTKKIPVQTVGDTMYFEDFTGAKAKVYSRSENLVWEGNGTTLIFIRLRPAQINMKADKRNAYLYGNTFRANLSQFKSLKPQQVDTLGFSNPDHYPNTDKSKIMAKFYEIEGHLFFMMKYGREKMYPVVHMDAKSFKVVYFQKELRMIEFIRL